MPKSLFIALAIAICTACLSGCGGGGGQSHVASQPNGPPKPRPPVAEPPSSNNHMQSAIASGVAFARDKYKNKQLDYEHAKANFISENLKAGGPPGPGSPPPGSWRVLIPVVGSHVNGDPGTDPGSVSPETAGIMARIFVVTPEGKVTEGNPIIAPGSSASLYPR